MGAAVFHRDVASAQKMTATDGSPVARSPWQQAIRQFFGRGIAHFDWPWPKAWERFSHQQGRVDHRLERRPREHPRTGGHRVDGRCLGPMVSGHIQTIPTTFFSGLNGPGHMVSARRIPFTTSHRHARGTFISVRHDTWHIQMHVHFTHTKNPCRIRW